MSTEVAAPAAEAAVEAVPVEETPTEHVEAEASEEVASEEVVSEEAPSEEGEISEEAQEAIARIINAKIAGEEKEFNLDDEGSIQDLIRLAQMGGGAQQRMQEAAELRRFYEERDALYKQNPWKALEEYGYDPDELAEMRIQQKIEEMQKSPEQLEQERIQQELEELRAKLKEEEDAKKALEMERLEMEAAQQLDEEINAALSATTSLPKSPYVVKRIADTMLWAMDNGFDDVTVEDVLPTVENEISREIQELISNVPEEFLGQLLGKQNMDRLRKSRLNKKTVQKKQVQDTGAAAKAPSKPKEKMSMRDFVRGNLTGKNSDLI